MAIQLFGSRLAAIAVLALAGVAAATTARAQSRAYVLSDPQGHPLITAASAEVVVIDTATGNKIARVALGVSASSVIRDLVFRADGSLGYVTDGADVAVFDPITNTLSSRFNAGSNPGRLLLSANGASLFATNTGTATITVVETATRTVAATITLPAEAIETALSPDGTRLYALARSDLASVYVVDLATMAVTTTVTTEAGPQHLGVHPDGSKLYLTHRGQFRADTPIAPAWLTVVDTQTFQPAGRLDLPSAASAFNLVAANETDRPVLLPDGSRLLVPQWVKGFRTSPTRFVDAERLNVIDPATLTIIAAVTLPQTGAGGLGRVVAATPAAGLPALVVGVWSTSRFDAPTNALQQVGSGEGFVRAVAVVPAPPCAFSVWPQNRYVRTSADAIAIDLPAPAGCNWSASFSSDWLTMTSPASGVGPGTITLVPNTLGVVPKRSTLTVAGQVVSIQQVIGSVIIDSLSEGATVSPPLTMSGWAADRTVLGQNGLPAIELRDGSDPPFTGVFRTTRPDISALYGSAYASSGFEVRIPRLGVGNHALRAIATSVLDGTVTTAVVNVTVVRKPTVRLDLIAGNRMTQPFRLAGWAVDGTAPTGVGVDAVQIWAHPVSGAAPILLGTPPYGIAHQGASAYMGSPIPWAYAGFELMVGGLAAGDYVVKALARSTVTGLYDSSAEVPITVAGGPQPPFGSFDTPAYSPFPLSGSIAVTGWALDDVAVERVEIWRDRVGGETTPPYTGAGPGNGKIFIANAPFVAGARPDIEALNPSWPNANRAGWGYLLLTHGLWNQGNGFYILHAFAYDQQGNATTLGSKGITVNNANSTKPFGSIDTPGIGETVSGGIWNFGWALTPNATPSCTIGTAGVQVAIDSGPLMPVTYGDARTDIAAAFTGYTNSAGAGGAYYIDTTSLTNGTHLIGWFVTDSCGRQEGIGSRFFTVMNGSSDVPLASRPTTTAADAVREIIEQPVIVRRALEAVPVEATADGNHLVTIRQDERIEVELPATSGVPYAGYQIVNGTRRALPEGATLDGATGTFYWQPATGFLGAFELEFVPVTGGVVRVQVVVSPPQ